MYVYILESQIDVTHNIEILTKISYNENLDSLKAITKQANCNTL